MVLYGSMARRLRLNGFNAPTCIESTRTYLRDRPGYGDARSRRDLAVPDAHQFSHCGPFSFGGFEYERGVAGVEIAGDVRDVAIF
jgi:hypothetical protein